MENRTIHKEKLCEWIDAMVAGKDAVELNLNSLFLNGCPESEVERIVHQIKHTTDLLGYELAEVVDRKVKMHKCNT